MSIQRPPTWNTPAAPVAAPQDELPTVVEQPVETETSAPVAQVEVPTEAFIAAEEPKPESAKDIPEAEPTATVQAVPESSKAISLDADNIDEQPAPLEEPEAADSLPEKSSKKLKKKGPLLSLKYLLRRATLIKCNQLTLRCPTQSLCPSKSKNKHILSFL